MSYPKLTSSFLLGIRESIMMKENDSDSFGAVPVVVPVLFRGIGKRALYKMHKFL